MHIIDMRSDTVTRPTDAMRQAMASAKVGDDVFGEDPTVNRLEEMAAEMTGKQAALFVTSGTMGNLVSQLAHCGRGDEMILGDQSHIFYYEQGGSAAVGGIHPRIVPNRADGTMALADLAAAIRPDNIHFPSSRLVVLENTHVCGSEGFIARARKLLGGGMRQIGILAAAGIVSLTEMVDRLAEDHANARAFARGLADMDGILIDVDRIKTNLVFFSIQKSGLTASTLAGKLDKEGLRVLPIPMDEDRIRAVIHYEISAGDIQQALGIIKGVLDRE